jgi:hypothetical protein
MMALMPRNAIYLFDVCSVVLFVDRVECAFAFERLGRVPPKNGRRLAAMPLRKFFIKFPRPISRDQKNIP